MATCHTDLANQCLQPLSHSSYFHIITKMKWVIKQFFGALSGWKLHFFCSFFSIQRKKQFSLCLKILHMPRKAGLEPVISSVTGWRFNQLSYFPWDYLVCTFSDFLSNLIFFYFIKALLFFLNLRVAPFYYTKTVWRSVLCAAHTKRLLASRLSLYLRAALLPLLFLQ